jgi:hypothetical protein
MLHSLSVNRIYIVNIPRLIADRVHANTHFNIKSKVARTSIIFLPVNKGKVLMFVPFEPCNNGISFVTISNPIWP